MQFSSLYLVLLCPALSFDTHFNLFTFLCLMFALYIFWHFIFTIYLFIFLFKAACAAYGSSQPRAESELQLPAYIQPQQRQIWAASGTYTAACSNAGSLTHWPRPGIKPTASQIPCQVLKMLSHYGNSCFIFKYLCFHI